jgi:hypothetical protein
MKHYSVKGASLPQALERGIENVVVSQWQPAPAGGEHLRLQLSRPSGEELLAEVGSAAVQVGYALVEAEVEEFVDNAAKGALVGLFGSGAATGAATRNPSLALIAAAIGAYVGKQVGASMRTLVASRRYQLHRNGRWIVTELLLPAQEQPTFQPDQSAAFLPT